MTNILIADTIHTGRTWLSKFVQFSKEHQTSGGLRFDQYNRADWLIATTVDSFGSAHFHDGDMIFVLAHDVPRLLDVIESAISRFTIRDYHPTIIWLDNEVLNSSGKNPFPANEKEYEFYN